MNPEFAETCGFFDFEPAAQAAGFQRIAGLDEVGRGPLAGPVVAVAAVVTTPARFSGLNDSKKLSEKRREALFSQLTEADGVHYGIGIVSSEHIDHINILQATYRAMRQALAELSPLADFVLVDGRPVPGLPCPSHNLIKGDGRCVSIAAASIIAKVTRDRMMVAYDQEFPGYAFARHKGYGTKAHLNALQKLGACPIHRRSFSPVRNVVEPTLFDR